MVKKGWPMEIHSDLLIREFNDIRELLRDMYIYGCRGREDFDAIDIGTSKYDLERKRLAAYLPEHFLHCRGKQKIWYCTYQPLEQPDNSMAEVYRNASFSMTDIIVYTDVLQILQGRASGMSVSDIYGNIREKHKNAPITEATLRNKLQELERAGLVVSERKKKLRCYSLNTDIWKDFSDSQLLKLYRYLDFLKNVHPFEMPYFLLQKKLGLYLECERNVTLRKEAPFLYRQNHLIDVLDNEILLELLKAVKGNRLIELQCKHTFFGEFVRRVIPVAVTHSSRDGAQYLLGCEWNQGEERELLPSRQLLSTIRSVTVLGETPTEKKQEAVKACDRVSTWFVAPHACGEPQEVVIEFTLDENRDRDIIRLLQEGNHGGRLERTVPGKYLFKILVSDAGEMYEWIMSFGEKARVISSGKSHLEAAIPAVWREVLKKYESLS